MNKKAFTIAEMLVVLSIVALISLLTITTLRPYIAESTMSKQYYRAYTTVNTAVYNILADVIDCNQARADYIDARMAAGNANPTQGAPTECQFPSTPQTLCNAMTSTTGYTSSTGYVGYINTAWATCANIQSAGANINTLVAGKDDAALRSIAVFKATNEMYFYMQPISITSPVFGAENFTLIWVDMNGNKRPNSTLSATPKQPADIVPFLVSQDGKVTPLGIPTFDYRYMTATVKFSTPDIPWDMETVAEMQAKTAEEIAQIIKDNEDAGSSDPFNLGIGTKDENKPAKRTFAEAKLRAYDKYYNLDVASIADPFADSVDSVTKAMSDLSHTQHPSCREATAPAPALRAATEYPACGVKVNNPDNRLFRNFRNE